MNVMPGQISNRNSTLANQKPVPNPTLIGDNTNQDFPTGIQTSTTFA